ncbi:MAG: M50 family metallopeptidase [Chloroflexi bacterium]|nr:M50 family metallopeptidase [Chloroflexota bacterium]MCL5109066.1 M50 family metallopeptidase [Chloroflexota bacterium]
MFLNIVAFLLIFGVLVFVHELGHFVTAKLAGVKVEEFGFGFPPRLLAVRRGETEYSINAIPIGGFVRMLGEDNPQEPRSFASAPKRWRTTILLAGAGMNVVMAVLLFAGGYMAGWPTASDFEVQVRAVLAGSPAAQAGLQSGDVIVAMNGQSIGDTDQLRAVTQQRLGQETTLLIRRGNQEETLKVTPYTTFTPDRGALGVTISNQPLKVEPVYYPLGPALSEGAQRVGDTIRFTVTLPSLLAHGQVPTEAARPVGPVGIWDVTSQAAHETATTGWWFPLFYVAASLSVGLAIANVLPIPGLDGGRLLFVIIEAVRGRRISPEREGAIHMVGIAVLLTLSVLIAYYDLTAPLPGIDWGFK